MKSTRTITVGFLFALLTRLSGTSVEAESPLQSVNIFQGTDSKRDFSHGNTLPLVGLPWGMTDWAIENASDNWFFKPDGKVDGFRATHQPSPWLGDYGQFVLMPQTGAVEMNAAGRLIEYETKTAICRPDYERLQFKNGIVAELTQRAVRGLPL